MPTRHGMAEASGVSVMSEQLAIEFRDLSFHYGDRQALKQVTFDVQAGELFSLLGPNGSGKTTLFRLLSTLIIPQQGSLSVFGNDVRSSADAVRHDLGVVFQSPGLDGKLTVYENLAVQAALYGLSKVDSQARIVEVSDQLGVADRLQDHVDELSGGLRRRVELAKSLLHRPRLLIMDEPTTGLDPSARSDVWNYVHQLQQSTGMTVFMTTHLLEEADRADRIAILNEGELVALDQPDALRSELGGDVITIMSQTPEQLIEQLKDETELELQLVDGMIRILGMSDAAVVSELHQNYKEHIQQISVGKPSLEDVFIARTGHQFWGTS